MLAMDMPNSRQWMPLRLRAPETTKLRLGILAACALPWLGAVIFFWFLVEDAGSIFALMEQIRKDPAIFWVVFLPLFGVFTVGAFLVAYLSARSVMRRSHIRMLRLLWTGLRTALAIHGLTAIYQMIALVISMGTDDMSLRTMLRDMPEFVQIHLMLALFATTPLALMCTYIFRMVSLTRKPAQFTSTFD